MAAIAAGPPLPLPAFLGDAQGAPVVILAWTYGYSDAFGDAVGAIVARSNGRLEAVTLDDLTISHAGELRARAVTVLEGRAR